MGERWLGFQALRTGEEKSHPSEHLLCAHNFLLLRAAATSRPWRFLTLFCRGVSGCLIGTRLFQVSRLSPHKGRKCRLSVRVSSPAHQQETARLSPAVVHAEVTTFKTVVC